MRKIIHDIGAHAVQLQPAARCRTIRRFSLLDPESGCAPKRRTAAFLTFGVCLSGVLPHRGSAVERLLICICEGPQNPV